MTKGPFTILGLVNERDNVCFGVFDFAGMDKWAIQKCEAPSGSE